MAVPEGWQPQYNERATRRLLEKYKGRAHKLSEEQQQTLQNHAEAYNLPYYTGDFSLLDAIGQAGAGFIEGFTTLNIADYPDNEYEQIARNLGHLAGFAPGIMSKPAALLGARGFAKAAANMKSIPMKGADIATNYAKQAVKTTGKSFVGRSEAMQTARNFVMGNKAKHIVEGAFHLGTASAISAWQGGVDQMIEAGMGGAVAGGVFRTIGNLTPGTSTHEKVGKAIAGSLFMGLPSTVKGATTPEQVYEYVMGAYFGGNEVSWTRAKAMKAMKEIGKKAEKDPKWAGRSGMDPELWEGFNKLPEEVKPLLKKEAEKAWGNPDANKEGWMATELLRELKLEGKITEEQLVEKGFEATGEYRDGEQIYRLSPEIVRSKFQRFMTSGGAKGSDTEFAKQAEKVGIPTINYTFGGHAKGIRATGFQRLLSTSELQDADTHVNEANLAIGKNVPKKEFVRNLQRRNWYQVKYADTVYAVGEFEGQQKRGDIYIRPKTQVKGGTGLTVQMAINNDKAVYFFNQPEKQWYTWNASINKGMGGFTHIKSPPRPTRRFAGIGTSKELNPAGRQAIKSLFQDNFKPIEGATAKVEEVNKLSKNKERRDVLESKIEEKQKLIEELQDDIAVKELDGRIDVEPIKVRLEDVKQEQADLSKKFNQLAGLDYVRTIPDAKDSKETISSEISDKIDFEAPTELEIGKRSLQFTVKHLKKISDAESNALNKKTKQLELAKLVEEVLVETEDGKSIKEGGIPLYLRPGSKENLSENWADAVEKRIQETDKTFKLEPEARREMRQWMTRKNLGKMVAHLQSDGKTVFEMSNPTSPISRAGNRKHQEEPVKIIEEAYKEAGGSSDVSAYMVLDHVTLRDSKTGKNTDLDLSRYRDKVGNEIYEDFLSSSMKKMAKKDYYALGGSGDKDRIIWVKYNPQVTNLGNAELVKSMANISKIASSKHKKFKKELDRSAKEFVEKYNMKKSDFEKMWLSNLYYDLQMNGMEINDANIKTLLTHPGFIKNSAAFNKRQQIWMNNAWAGDVEFIKKQGVKLTDVVNKETGEVKENYNYTIVRDLTKEAEKLDHTIVGLKNSELPENVDGAILVSNKVLDAINADFGNPKSGQNKSFIVSPNGEKGALLGKYMMHAAGNKMSELMDAKGIHMIMQESAVKQRGLREIGDYNIKNGKLEITGEVYNDLSPEHVKGNFGVYGNKHFIENQRVPKQLLQALLPTSWSPVEKNTINNMFNKIIQERWDGDPAMNKRLESYLNIAKEGNLSPQEQVKFEETIVNNLDKVGIKHIVKAMKNEYAPGLSEAIYNKILKLEKNDTMSRFAEGTLTEEQITENAEYVSEFNSLADRVIKSANEWVGEQRSAGVDADITSLYMHKFIRDFRVKAVQNYLINSATKPKRDNSGVGFMRPYDKAMRLDLDKANPRLKELETNDEIFFLDAEFKKLNIKLDMPGSPKIKDMTLGELWKRYDAKEYKGKQKEYVEDVFEAVTVRVPMDSMSGAQVLKFAGFTGREGHGILLHGRAMRAEGGADLDGDKSFMFFGGRGGFDKEWKQSYKSNKKEFYRKEKGVEKVSDNKGAKIPGTNKTYRDVLAFSPDAETKEYLTSKASQYSPHERIRISEAAVDGRNQLGPAVVNKQVMSSAYSAIIENGGKDEFTVRAGRGKNKGIYKISITAKTENSEKDHQRNMGRAQVGLSSDPLDELGLKGHQAWFKEMWNAHFKIDKIEKLGKKSKKVSTREFDALFGKRDMFESGKLRDGILGNLANINRAYWSRNYAEGRKFTMDEILSLGDSIQKIPEKSIDSSFLAKTGKLLHGLEWSDSIFGKINEGNIQTVYKLHEARLNDYAWLKDYLNRPSFKVKYNPYVESVRKHRLWTYNGLLKTSRNVNDFRKAIKDTMFEDYVLQNEAEFYGISKKGRKNAGEYKHVKARRELLRKLASLGEDYVINDVTDIASLDLIAKKIKQAKDRNVNLFIKEDKTLEQQVDRINNEVERLKINSYLMAKDRSNMERHVQEIADYTGDMAEAFKLYNEYYGIKEKKPLRKTTGEPTAELDQNRVDKAIMEFKTNLTREGAELFDQMMLGSINRGNMEAINKLQKIMGKPDRANMDLLYSLRKEASKTRISRLGFNSEAIPESSIKEHLGGFASNFKETSRPLSENALKEIDKSIETYESRVEENKVDPALIETNIETGYIGLKRGNLDAENKAIVVEIADILKQMHNKDSQDINGLVRGVIGKDLNAMNKNDFVVFRNWLNDIRRGNLVQRMFHKKGPVELNKRHWALFPKAVNRELMRDDLVMIREKGFFTDRTGTEVEGIVSKPTHYVDIVQNFLGKMNDSAVNVSDKYIKKFNESMLFHSGLEDSQKLWEIAVRKREAEYTETDRIRNSDKPSDVKDRALAEIYSRLKDAEKKNDWKNLQNNNYTVTVDGKRIEMTGKEIVNRINRDLTNLFTEMYEFIEGKPGALDMYQYARPKGGVEYNYKLFIQHLQEHTAGLTPKGWIKEGIADVPSHFGIDGLRRMARAMQIDMMPKEGQAKDIRNQLISEPVIQTGHIGGRNRETREKESSSYFPHMFFDKSVSKKMMKEAIRKVIETPEKEMNNEEKKLEIKKLFYRNKSLGGEMRFEELEEWTLYEDVMNDIAQGKKISEEKIKWFNANERAGSMKSRDIHMGGWSIDPVVVESYIRSLSNTYHRQISQMFGRQMVQDMYKQMIGKWGKEQTTAWQNFMKLYVQDAIGNPSIIPEYMYTDSKMKLKGTPYAWFADNKVRDRINKFGKSLGLGDKTLPEELRGVDTETLRHWSNLEAQYNMATLLAHPKSMVANIFGGTAHTIQSAGWGNFVKARDYNYLSKINPEWTNKQAVNDFVISQGVLPEYLVYEMGLQKEFQNNKGKSFLKELSAKLSRDPEMSEKTIGEIAENYGLKDRAMNFAAKFMTIPERALRRDAFMAHYVHAWQKYGSAIKEYDHPYIIQMAKKGVRATQFLYNAPFRPAFARTALGKVMTRFQLWGWNSVRFRNDVRRQARIYGFKPGTEEWARFERTMQTDLVTFALANVFAYSLFESNLPQPWGWAQDYADWIFGDEGERDKAFYGAWPKAVAPLQMVTPPGLRLAGPTFNALLSDDWSKMSQYYIYTMMPFGRMIRDVNPYAKGNLLENPMRVFEKVFGFPMMQMQRNVTAWKDKEDAEGNVVPGKKIKKLYPGMG